MPRPKSGYKRQSSNDYSSSGAWIEIKVEENYQRLKLCAKANSCTLGQWAERSLRYALTGEPYIPPYRHSGPATPTKRARGFRLSDMTYAWVEARAGEDKAMAYIGATLLSLAAIELTRHCGEQAEQEWTTRYRI